MIGDVHTVGIVKEIPSNKPQNSQERQADTSGVPRDPHDKLDNFLKKNLQSLGIAQIMIGLKCFLFGIIGSLFLLSSKFRNIFLCFYIGYPFWAAMSFIISGSLTIWSTKKHTKFLIELNIRTNIISTVISSIGLILLSRNLFDVLLFRCPNSDDCIMASRFTINLVIVQMVVTCVQFVISFPLAGLTYHVNGTALSWVSALSCLNTLDSEDSYQDLSTLPVVYEDLKLQEECSADYDP